MQRNKHIFIITNLILWNISLAFAWAPPLRYVAQEMAQRNLGVRTFRSHMKIETDGNEYREIIHFDRATGWMRIQILDSQDREVILFKKNISEASLIAQYFLSTSSERIIKKTESDFFKIQRIETPPENGTVASQGAPENSVAATPTPEPLDTRLDRARGQVAWVYTLATNPAEQLWILKDKFVPFQLFSKFDDEAYEVILEDYLFKKSGFALPSTITVYKGQGLGQGFEHGLEEELQIRATLVDSGADADVGLIRGTKTSYSEAIQSLSQGSGLLKWLKMLR